MGVDATFNGSLTQGLHRSQVHGADGGWHGTSVYSRCDAISYAVPPIED